MHTFTNFSNNLQKFNSQTQWVVLLQIDAILLGLLCGLAIVFHLKLSANHIRDSV